MSDINDKKFSINEPFKIEEFRELAHKTVDMLADYLDDVKSEDKYKVMNHHKPEDLLEIFQTKVNNFQKDSKEDFTQFLTDILDYSTHLHSPNYIAHQTTAPLPLSALAEFFTSVLNSSTACYEVSPVGAILENILINLLTKKFGFNDESGGFLTLGGSIGNVTALLAAREVMTNNTAWHEGNMNNFSLMVSDQAHYCVSRTVNIMGLSSNNIHFIPYNNEKRINLDNIQQTYNTAKSQGYHPKILALSACNTAMGIIENTNLIEVAEFCQANDIWLHIDAAHGGPTIFSKKYKCLLENYHLADSIVFDFHKMMLVPSVSTAILFKNKVHSYKAVSHNAPYLYKNNVKMDNDWFNISKRTLECTKPALAVKSLIPILYYGEDFLDDYITYLYDLTRLFYQMLNETKDFETFHEPDTNILCFRYIGLESQGLTDNLSQIQAKLYQQILESNEFYLVMTELNQETYLRVTLINPRTQESTLVKLLEHIRIQAKSLLSTAR